MSTLNPYMTLTYPFREVLVWIARELSKVGLQVEQTFDLQVARSSHVGCPCPHHGTDQCNCQMVVLLVRSESGEPLTLILHGNDGQTNLSIADLSGKRVNSNLDSTVRMALTLQEVVLPHKSCRRQLPIKDRYVSHCGK